jgi:YHS domain-containing protein
MLRLILVALLLMALFFIVRNLVRDMKAPKAPRTVSGARDQMVQDPVCRVYVLRDSALTTTVGEQTYYFCSKECAQVFERRATG